MSTDDHRNMTGREKDRVRHYIQRPIKAEDALRFSEERYRALFRDNPTMIVTLDADLTMLSVNPICAKQLGYMIDELEGRSVLNLFYEEDRPAVAEKMQKCLLDPYKVHHWQFRKVCKDGCLLWVEETAQAVYDLNGALNLLVVCQDVTERKRADEERKQLLLQLEAVLESINEGVVISDLKGNIITMNQEALALYEYQSIEQVHRQLSEYQDTYDLFDMEGRPVTFEQWPLCRVLRGERFADLELHIRHKHTGKRWIGSYSGTPVQTKSGESILSLVTVRDVTEKKSAEEEIKRLNVILTARAADLEDANRELEAFNYTVAHDLRQPLNLISSYCQAITMLCGEQIQGECKGFIQGSYEGAVRMNQLIESLLNFSRMGHVEPHREIVDLCALAHEVASMLKQTEPERQVDFLIADGISANADAGLLHVVLTNLLGNAWKYTATREKAIIEFNTTQIRNKPVYFVRDNGTGFDRSKADKLFVPFQRLSTTEEYQGFGIGLATVERIIRRHGGRVWAEGEPDNGATFYFTVSAD